MDKGAVTEPNESLMAPKVKIINTTWRLNLGSAWKYYMLSDWISVSE